jgi:hypothetical protein
MHQHSVALFLYRKGMSATEINEELVSVLGGEALAHSTVTRTLHRQAWTD